MVWKSNQESRYILCEQSNLSLLGKVIKKVDTFYASSQTCHCCRYKNEETKDLNVRDWTCPKCHSNHDRDVNASINILMQGILAN